MGARIATSAGCWSGEIRNHRAVAINTDNTFSQKLCRTWRWKNPIMAAAPILRRITTSAAKRDRAGENRAALLIHLRQIHRRQIRRRRARSGWAELREP